MQKCNQQSRQFGEPARRMQNEKEKHIAQVLQDLVSRPGGQVLQLLLQLDATQWSEFVHGKVVSKLCEALVPIARAALKRYRLDQNKEHVDDAVQRIHVKLLEGRYFKRYRAMESLPKAFILSCAPNHARTIARSIWRDTRRYQTNHDWPQK